MLIKKIFRLLRIIIHVFRGVLQVFFYLRGVDGIFPDNTQAIIKRWNQRFIELLNIELKIIGELHKGQALVVSNHVSWKDILLLSAISPTHYVAKKEIESWPVVGWFGRKTGALFIKRGSITALRKANEKMASLLLQGEKITLFPEGGTSNGYQIKPFYPGLFQAAINSQAPVQPVVVMYKVDGQLSADIPYIDNMSLLENLWTILGYDHITAEVHFTAIIQATTESSRKALSEQAYWQMHRELEREITTVNG